MIVFQKIILSLSLLALTSCAGYKLGGNKPQALEHVERIHVPLAVNSTQVPRAAAFVTNGVVDALVEDGTYRLGTEERSDATLYVELAEITYGSVRTNRFNRLRPLELSMTVRLQWEVQDANDPLKVLDSGSSIGRTGLFVDPNLQTAQQTVINDAIQRAATSLVARLADGF